MFPERVVKKPASAASSLRPFLSSDASVGSAESAVVLRGDISKPPLFGIFEWWLSASTFELFESFSSCAGEVHLCMHRVCK
jgi:hypothetical protein